MFLCWGRGLQICCRRSWCRSLITASLGNAAQGQNQGIARHKCFASRDVEKHSCGCDGMVSVLVTWMSLQGMSLCVFVVPLGIWKSRGAKKSLQSCTWWLFDCRPQNRNTTFWCRALLNDRFIPLRWAFLVAPRTFWPGQHSCCCWQT